MRHHLSTPYWHRGRRWRRVRHQQVMFEEREQNEWGLLPAASNNRGASSSCLPLRWGYKLGASLPENLDGAEFSVVFAIGFPVALVQSD